MTWIQTYTGKRFCPLKPKVDLVCLEDIAHALALTCRFGGHCRRFYSVAQHSVLVSRHCDPADATWGLMHDAAEAYLVDLPQPIKRGLREAGVHAFDQMEEQIMEAVCLRFDLPYAMPVSVGTADRLLLSTEARDLMDQGCDQWTTFVPPLEEKIEPMEWREAEKAFLLRAKELGLVGAKDVAGSPAVEEQPAPMPAEGDSWAAVIADMQARRSFGIAKYGTPLQPRNGRSSLVDAYQEALDMVVYLKNLILEEGDKR